MSAQKESFRPATGIRRQSLPEQVAGAILEAVVERRLKPGDSLPSASELAEQFGVSRTVVREAIADLMGRGVISRTLSREPIISMPGPDQLRELLRVHVSQDAISMEQLVELRLPLEVQSARLAAARRTEEQLARIVATFETLASEQNEARFHEADIQFHRDIALATGNILLPLVLDSLTGVLHDFRRRWYAAQRSGGKLSELVDEHRNILDAVVAGDPDAAAAAMTAHFVQGLEKVRGATRA